MGIIALIVTYGERTNFLFQVIKRLEEENVEQLVIVVNGCSKATKKEIYSYLNGIKLKVHIIEHEENLGSAGGFSSGISFVKELRDYTRVLILDDDNLIPNGLINALKFYQLSEDEILYISRKDRANLLKSVSDSNPFINISSRNSCLGRDIFKKLITSYEVTNSTLVCAPYSGLYISKKIINICDLPSKDYYLYGDDYEFTYKLVTRYGATIKVYSEKEIEDLETSFHLMKGSRKFLDNRYTMASIDRVYYSVRNQLFFEKLRVDNKFIYGLNLSLSIIAFCFMFLVRMDVKRLKVFLIAIYHGLIGINGKYEKN